MDPQTSAAAPLANPQHERFCHEYLVDFNASAAAERSGYSAATCGQQGHRLLKNAEIQRRVKELAQQALVRADVTVDRIVEEARRIAFADIRDVVTWGPDGVTFEASAEIPAEAAACVSEVKQTATPNGNTLSLKMHSKQPALELLAKYKDIFPRAGSEKEALHIVLRRE